MLRRNWARVDLKALQENYALLTKCVSSDTQVMCVIKADAYGHGMVRSAQALAQVGATHFAVATPDEGVTLRESGVQGEILVLGAATPRAAQQAILHHLTQTVFTPETVQALEKETVRLQDDALVHIKLDTGMNRIGLRTPEEARALAIALARCPHVKPTGIYTHMAVADEPNADGSLNDFSLRQLHRFAQLRACFDPAIPAHAANSALALLGSPRDCRMVRAGIVLYGYPPVKTALPFRAVMSWHSEVVYVKTIRAGETVGYGCAFTASRDMRVATVAVGYGDGYHRACSKRGMMLIRGRRAPILGRVCMDQTMVDVSDIPGAAAGDEAVVLGRQGDEEITAEEMADWAGTISYEVLTSIAQRVPRLYC